MPDRYCNFHMQNVDTGDRVSTPIEGSQPTQMVNTIFEDPIGAPDPSSPCRAGLCARRAQLLRMQVDSDPCLNCGLRQFSYTT